MGFQQTKKPPAWEWFILLSDQDSNLNRQNQNLQCYRYTIGQQLFEGAKLYKKPSLQTITVFLFNRL